MATHVTLPLLSVEDALARVVGWLRDPRRDPHAVSREPIASVLDVRALMGAMISERIREMQEANPQRGPTSYTHDNETNAGPIHTAVWELCRRGILRPRVFANRDQAPLFGWYFDVTPYGREWLEAATGYEALPAEYNRFVQLLVSHGSRFGAGYQSRSGEAVSCYQAQTYLACCVMCGAAAESILLALAVARTRDEVRVLRDYRAGGGRSRIERLLTGQQPAAVQEAFETYTELLKYWRDDAAHGAAVRIDEEEAFTALILLLRFARFADEQWAALTSPAGQTSPQATTASGEQER